MSVWLTPNLQPFVGGTYFPPEDGLTRVGFRTVLLRIRDQVGMNGGGGGRRQGRGKQGPPAKLTSRAAPASVETEQERPPREQPAGHHSPAGPVGDQHG